MGWAIGSVPTLGARRFRQDADLLIEPDRLDVATAAPTVDDAYIMDQWTAKSVNLLTGRSVLEVNEYDWVVDKNDRTCYEELCGIVDQLAFPPKN